ncbi:MAG: hypothetical protein SOZ25_07870, partial [Prevotella sp.]|nr:hypothetical protein [Prevotella sp.]
MAKVIFYFLLHKLLPIFLFSILLFCYLVVLMRNKISINKNYCCPLKLRPSRARVCMHMQASKNKKLGWLLFEESALFGNFAAAKQT